MFSKRKNEKKNGKKNKNNKFGSPLSTSSARHFQCPHPKLTLSSQRTTKIKLSIFIISQPFTRRLRWRQRQRQRRRRHLSLRPDDLATAKIRYIYNWKWWKKEIKKSNWSGEVVRAFVPHAFIYGAKCQCFHPFYLDCCLRFLFASIFFRPILEHKMKLRLGGANAGKGSR